MLTGVTSDVYVFAYWQYVTGFEDDFQFSTSV